MDLMIFQMIPEDKGKILCEFKEKYVEKKFDEQKIKIYEKFNENEKKIKEEIINNFRKVCIHACELQKKDLKGGIQFIHISYLRTSLVENKGVYRIDLYDDRWFLDKQECFINISVDFIYQSLFSHIAEIEKHKKEYGRNITDMDIEKIKLREGNKYHELSIEILKSMIDDFIGCDEYKSMEKSEEIMIYAGEYKDYAVLLYENNQ